MERPESRIAGAARQVGYRELDAASTERLVRYLDLLMLWNRRFHLTGDRDRDSLVDRHVADSLAVAAEVSTSGHLVDIGSGAGFPGVVVACARPDARVSLLESRRRPVSFLAEVARTVPLPGLDPILGRAEDAPDRGLRDAATVAVSRAVRADAFLPLAYPLVVPGGIALVMATPHQSLARTNAVGVALGFALESTRDYVLPRGEKRILVRFRKPDAAS
ncbi:MAG: 16S rRNA (guanine(527)-N(7))-methyltransferase RsmG [bacterium]|nr:16S rRNA (guanine(527)-N(7))-methyltransferase RsmG [bacterium]